MLRTGLSVFLIVTGFILLMAHGANPMPVLMIMIGAFALLRAMIWRVMHSRNLRKLPGFGEAVVYTFTTTNIEINGEDRQAKVKWSDLFEAVTTKQGLLLYHGKKSYTWIPQSAFDSSDDFQTVSDWSKAN